MSIEKEVAQDLLDIKAVFLSPNEPFTWASGIKSPIYCDNRITLGYPKVRKMIAESLVKKISEKYPEVEVIAGTATAGIPHAAWVADRMELPMVYIRGKKKDHGKANQIEGVLKKGQKMVIIEDLISTGGSVLEAYQAAVSEGADVLGVAAIFTYELQKGKDNFDQEKISLTTLTNYSALLEIAVKEKYIQASELDSLKAWRKGPEHWLPQS